MDSRETPAASSSRGAVIPPEATSAGGHGDWLEDIASGEPTRGFQLQILKNIDSAGEFSVPIRAPPQHDFPRAPAPQAPMADQAPVLENEIVNLVYDHHAGVPDPVQDCLEYYNNADNDDDDGDDDDDDDDDDDVKDVMVEQELLVMNSSFVSITAPDQVDVSSEETLDRAQFPSQAQVVEETPDQLSMLQQSSTSGVFIVTCAPLNAVPQPSLPIGNTEIARTASTDYISNPKMAVPSMEPIDEVRSLKRAAVEKVDGERAGVLFANTLEQASPPQKRLAVEEVDPAESTYSQGSASSSDCSGDCSTAHTDWK